MIYSIPSQVGANRVRRRAHAVARTRMAENMIVRAMLLVLPVAALAVVPALM